MPSISSVYNFFTSSYASSVDEVSKNNLKIEAPPSLSSQALSYLKQAGGQTAKKVNKLITDGANGLRDFILQFKPYDAALMDLPVPILARHFLFGMSGSFYSIAFVTKHITEPFNRAKPDMSLKASIALGIASGLTLTGVLWGVTFGYQAAISHFMDQGKTKEALLVNLVSEFAVLGVSIITCATSLKKGIDLLYKTEEKNPSADQKEASTSQLLLEKLKTFSFLGVGAVGLLLGIQRAYQLIVGYQIASELDFEQVQGVLFADGLPYLNGSKSTNAVLIDAFDANLKVEYPKIVENYFEYLSKKPLLSLLYRNAQVRYYRAGSESKLFSDLSKATQVFGQKIQNLIFAAHGNPSSILLGQVDLERSRIFHFDHISSYMEKEGHLILDSCLTGYDRDIFGPFFGKWNLGKSMSNIMKDIHIFANQAATNSSNTDFFFKNNRLHMKNVYGKINNATVYMGNGTSEYYNYGYFKWFAEAWNYLTS